MNYQGNHNFRTRFNEPGTDYSSSLSSAQTGNRAGNPSMTQSRKSTGTGGGVKQTKKVKVNGGGQMNMSTTGKIDLVNSIYNR